MKKIAKLYMRYSSHQQNEQSIEGQRTVCMDYAERNGYTVIGEYVDRAISGKTDQRDAFQAMISDAAIGGFSYIIVYKGDRFSRNRYESAIYKKKLKDCGVKVVSATENIPDTPEGIILESLMEGLSEYYSAELAQKVKRGMIETAKKGNSTGRLPFGYCKEGKRVSLDPERAPIALDIFRLYSEGHSAPQILKVYEKVTRDDGTPLTTKYIYKMLTNPRYIGRATYAGTEFPDLSTAIVPMDIWDKVQSILEDNKHHKQVNRNCEFVLTRYAFCGSCGSPLIGDSGTSKNGSIHNYYSCSGRKNKKNGCEFSPMKKDELERIVFESCVEFLQSGYVEQIIERAYQIRQEQIANDSTMKVLETDLKRKQKIFDNYMDAIGQGLFAGLTNERLVQAQADVEIAKEALAKHKLSMERIASKDDYRLFFERFLHRQINNAEFYESVLKAIVERICVYSDRIVIVFKFGDKKQKTIELCSGSLPLGSPVVTQSNISIYVSADFIALVVMRQN